MNLQQVMIFVHNIEEAKKFYVDKLGLEMEQNLIEPLGMFVLKNQGCLLTVHGGHPDREPVDERKIVIAFSVDNLEAEIERLKAMNITLHGEIVETPIHKYQAFIDPSGNIIEIGQYN